MYKFLLHGYEKNTNSNNPVAVDTDGLLKVADIDDVISGLSDVVDAIAAMEISLDVIPAGSITGEMIAAAAGITGGQLAAGVKGNQIGPFPIIQSGLTASKDVITPIPLGFIGSIVGVYAIYTAAAGTSSGVGTLDFILSSSGQVQSTGPATVTLTLSHTAALNSIVNQSAAPTLQNTFVAADTLKIHYTQTTTFASDTGVLWVFIVTN
jgi:hypothetical protein